MGKTRADYEREARDLGIDPTQLSWHELRTAVNSPKDSEVIDLEAEVPSTGIGDAVERAAKATGLDKVAEKILGDDCGCKKRKEFLNHFKSYVMINKGTMNAEIMAEWKGFRQQMEEMEKSKQKKEITYDQLKWVVSVYNSVFQTNIGACSGCIPGKVASHYIFRLNGVYDKMKAA